MTARRPTTLTDAEIEGTAPASNGVSTVPYSRPLPPETDRAAARTVAVRSVDLTECRRLLDMLGLTA